jgi:hypothetical protein
METINHINAGIIHTEARMSGLTMEQALAHARSARLHSDLNSTPHRQTVLRLLRTMWARHDAEASRAKEIREAQAAFDAKVAEAFPAEWARAEAKTGRKRREARRALRHRFAPERYADGA